VSNSFFDIKEDVCSASDVFFTGGKDLNFSGSGWLTAKDFFFN
jgi:hypothetical protein